MKVFTIIVTYNALRHNWIYKCIDSLLESDLTTEIVVIDNASTDNTCNEIKSKYPQVQLIQNSENKGFGAANNQGMEYGIQKGGDYFFLLNQDAWIEKDTISRLVMQSEQNPQFGVISPLHLTGNGAALDYNFSNYVSPYYCKSFYSDFVLNKIEEKIYELPFVNAAAWLLPKKTLEVVGGFSPSFFHYGEDDNYCHRIIFHKLKIGVFPFAKIFHDRQDRTLTRDESIDNPKSWNLKFSNPLHQHPIEVELKYLRKNLLKNKLIGRKKSVLHDEKKFKFLSQNQHQIEDNKKISQTTVRYKFLNIPLIK